MIPRSLTLGFSLSLCLSPLALAEKNVLFIAGPKSHGPGQHEHPAGCEMLATYLRNSGLGILADVSLGWPHDEAKVTAADSIVIYGDGLADHVANGHVAPLRARMEAGKGLVILHFALEPDDAELVKLLDEAIGGYFDPAWSVNPVWKMTQPILAQHPITQGVSAFEIEEEFYYHMKLRPEVVPLLQALPPISSLGEDGPRSGNPEVRKALAVQVPQTLAWAVENPNKSRGFGFTGGHFHAHWSNENFRKLVLNGIAWTARIEIPESGVTADIKATPAHPNIDVAIAKGDLADVKLHLAADPTKLDQGATEKSRSPLEQAVLRNKQEIAIFLLDQGANPNTADASKRTPLHLAIDRNNPAIITALLKAGATPDLRDKGGWTPLHHAAAKNQLETTKALIAGGANPMTLSDLGGTPLHEAAASGGKEVIEFLLANKVDPTIKSKQNVNALDLAKEYKNTVAIEVLEKVK